MPGLIPRSEHVDSYMMGVLNEPMTGGGRYGVFPPDGPVPPPEASADLLVTSYFNESGEPDFYVDLAGSSKGIVRRYMAQYDADIVQNQRMCSEFDPEDIELMRGATVELTREAGLRNMASYTIFSTSEGEIYPGLFVPAKVLHEAPLHMRQKALERLRKFREDGMEAEKLDEAKADISEFMHSNNSGYGVLGAVLNLPTAAEVVTALRSRPGTSSRVQQFARNFRESHK